MDYILLLHFFSLTLLLELLMFQTIAQVQGVTQCRQKKEWEMASETVTNTVKYGKKTSDLLQLHQRLKLTQ